MKAIAIIPARGGSKRIPRKNIVEVGGLPMMAYPIRAALKSGQFEKVIVSTEDSEIKDIACHYGAEVIDRPIEMASDTAFEAEAYKQVLESFSVLPTYFCGIYATAIFIEPDDFSEAFALMEGETPADVVMGASRYPIHPFKALQNNDEGYLEMVYPKECKMRSQTYPDYVASNGTFYWCRTESYLKNLHYYPQRLKAYVLPAHRAVDIDEPEDLERARLLMAVKYDE